MSQYPTYRERGLPVVQEREIRLHNDSLIDGKRTMWEYLSLYRRGRLEPLRYKSRWVPVRPCRQCGLSRPEDGTPCASCGAYQHCALSNLDAGGRAAPVAVEPLAVPKRINPRRSIRNGR